MLPHRERLGMMLPHRERLGMMLPHRESLGTMLPHRESLGTMLPHRERLGTMLPHRERLGTMLPHRERAWGRCYHMERAWGWCYQQQELRLTEKSMFFLSWLTALGSGIASVCLRMLTLSPVRMDWSIFSVVERIFVTRISAGILSPTKRGWLQHTIWAYKLQSLYVHCPRDFILWRM